MSFQTDITNAVANLTQRLNTITEQARKIFELPWQSILRPSSKLQVSNDEGNSEFITIQQIVDASLSFRQNQLLEANITVDDTNIIVDAGAKWIINNVNYELTSDFTENIPYAADGYTRNDILYADEFNQIHRLAGPETEGVSPTPNTPINTVLVTVVSVTDATVGNTPPVIGNDPDLQKVLNVNNIATDVGIILDHSTETSVLNLSNEDIIAENGSSKVTLNATETKPENTNESNSYGSNSITFTDKITGYISKLSFLRTAPGFVQFNLRANKASGFYNLVTDDELASSTDDLNEGSTNLYFTTARVLAALLSGISFATGGTIVSTDSVLVAFGKIQKQITDLSGVYQTILTEVNFGSFINGLSSKTTPVNADSVSIVDSADSNKQKKVSLTNFKAFLKTYFDTLYLAISDLPQVISATIVVDFPSTPANTETNVSFTVTGAAVGDVIAFGAPALATFTSYFVFISAANTVTFRFRNSTIATIDPPSATFKIKIFK